MMIQRLIETRTIVSLAATLIPILLSFSLVELSSKTVIATAAAFTLTPLQQRQQQQQYRQSSSSSTKRPPVVVLNAKSTGLQFHPQKNEFSRTVRPERFLKSRRDYRFECEANPEECEALAKRFDLKAIDRLEASLNLRNERSVGRSTPSSSTGSGVEVEGTVVATVTQTCVRTNEDFQVDLEFPLYCIVRPVASLSSLMSGGGGGGAVGTDGDDDEGYYNDKSSLKTKSRKKDSYRPQDRNIDEMDVMELQRLLQNDITVDDDVLMEDELIYCIDTGILDVGELVSQLFWLELDPYPKKPGSDPIQRSITG